MASSSTEDLELLSAAVLAIEPIASSSPSGKKLYDICKSFLQAASFSVDRQPTVSRPMTLPPTSSSQVFSHPVAGGFSLPLNTETPYEHIMAPQDWDTIMNEFELGIDAGAMASFVEPYIPFDGRMP